MAKDMKQGIIISLGSVNADFQVRVDQKPGSTTTMLAHDFMRLSGGKAANVAFLARRLGVSALLMARIGKDELGEQALGSLKDLGVDLTWVRKVAGVSTGVSMITVPPDGKKHIILAPNANDVWKEEEQDEVRQAIQQAPAGSVLVVDYEVPPFIVEQAITTAYEKGFSIIVDPSPADRVDEQLYSKINYLTPDASETESLTKIKPDSVENAVQAARKLIERGVKTAIVRLEEGGCVVMHEQETLYVPPVSVEVVDTTGAGDAFAGAFAVAVLEKQSLRDAACFASAVSLASITAYGSQPAYPTREQIQNLYDQVNAHIRTIHS
jgi:ribokinase